MTHKKRNIVWMLALLLIVVVILSVGAGALSISPAQVLSIALDSIGLESFAEFNEQQSVVLSHIRLPRVLLALLIGASLSTSGAAMQALFRNPLADPSIIGISAGAALTSALGIVVLGQWLNNIAFGANISMLSLITFGGALLTTWLVFKLSHVQGRVLVATMLLAGIAINAFASAGTGFLTYTATDDQLRSITFWTLGSLGGATWQHVLVMLPFALLPFTRIFSMSKALNAFALGETEAAHIGTPTEKVKRNVVIFAAMSVGASVSLAGIIGFVGLVVPHILRQIGGSDNHYMLPASALGGALLLIFADTVSRTVLAPAELPIGILTAIVGAPVFIGILLKDRNKMNWL